MKNRLIGMDMEELTLMVSDYSLPKFTAKQIAEWIYKKRVKSIEEMTNLSKAAREVLSSDYEVGITRYDEKVVSEDGTKKYLFPSHFAGCVESVMIPEEDRVTVCVSSQVGCKMACDFCMTGKGGFKGNLDAGEILSQILSIDEAESVSNVVFMGMGEPLNNYDEVKKAMDIITAEWGFAFSPKRVTLSTVGILPQLEFFLKDSKCHLAVSLHNPFSTERVKFMPAERIYPIEEIMRIIRSYDFSGQRRVSFEYIMFDGVNDSKRHADGVVRLLKGLECRVNLIRFHKIPESEMRPSPMEKMEMFRKRLSNAGVLTTIRRSRGEEITAACGMLSGQRDDS